MSLASFFTGKKKLETLPLHAVVVEVPFQQWGLYFIGEFKEKSINGHRWILIAMDYFTRWVEAIPLKKEANSMVIDFLEEKNFMRFRVKNKITTKNFRAFSSTTMITLYFYYGIVLSCSSNYYPQGNGLEESSNNNLMIIIKRIVCNNKKSWDSKIKYALWADRITKKDSSRKIPFELVYGTDVTSFIHLEIHVFKFMKQYWIGSCGLQQRINKIMEIDENKRHAYDHLWQVKSTWKRISIRRLISATFKRVKWSSYEIIKMRN